MPLRHFTRRRTLLLVLLALLGAHPAAAQGRNQVSLTGGPVRLVIDAFDADGAPIPVESTKAGLIWGRPSYPSKITVSAEHSGPFVWLSVEALAVENGLPTGPVSLTGGMPDTDLVVGILPGGRGGAQLRYVADAGSGTTAPPPDAEAGYVITYTITAQ